MKVVSYGGGVNSTAMVIYLINRGDVPDMIVFVDTGAELPETLDYVDYFSAYLKQKVGIEIVITRRNSEGLYNYCLRKRIMPIMKYRWCTSDWKVIPFDKYISQYQGKKNVYVGFDAEEDGRVAGALQKSCNLKNQIKVFPLHDANITRDDCINIIRVEGLKIPPKSGCYICPFTPKREFREMKRNKPELFKKALTLELQHPKGRTIKQGVALKEIDAQGELDFMREYDPSIPCGCSDGQY
ncbi:MAG: phosphoadenosine phosphosulfate reductase family protein [Nitrospirota bacterium]